MKYVSLMLLLAMFNIAQAIAGEVAQAKPASKEVIYDGKNQRLNILNTERAGQEAELLAAQSALPTAQDKVAAQKDIERIQLNIKMITAEIERAQKQTPTFIKMPNVTPVAKAEVPKGEAANVVNDAQSNQVTPKDSYEPWDVFKNFNQN